MALMESWHSMSSFLTPAVFFVLLNVVIATIVLSSRKHQRDPSASFAAPLFRTTSPVFERLKSFTLHRFRSGEIPTDPTSPNYNYTPSGLSNESGPDLIEESPSRSLDDAFRAVESSSHATIANSASSPPPPIGRTSSILDRIKSINLYRFRSGEAQNQQVQPDNYKEPYHYERSRSDPSSSSSRHGVVDAVVPKSEKKKKKIKKTVSSGEGAELSVRRRRREPAPAVVEEEEVEVDLHARADDFISKFKENLKIQRLNSILNYTEMLNRGR
ncbi:hypothetical protein LUZ60_000363 [Juncus effusus]|nr:hypothetical protein LUZ60_000363 [Juncus effusus]